MSESSGTSSSYQRIQPLAAELSDREAVAVEALGAVWRDRLDEMKDSRALARFNEQMYRRWAIETGILERLYSIDRGVTQVLVERGLDVSLIEHGSTDRPPEEVVAMLRDHREAVQYVMDFVAGQTPLSLHFIRSMHQLLTAHQNFVDALDQFGSPTKLPLRKGAWKTLPNNPTRPDGAIHIYCPPEFVEEEMTNLLTWYEQAADANCPTTVLSAWLHHRFTQIQPFQDGNGRVARALAAFVFVKRRLFPVVVDRDDRSAYIESLEVADQGDLLPLVQLWNKLERQAIESALSLSESVLDDAVPAPQNLLRTKLLEAIRHQARRRREALQAQQIRVLSIGQALYYDIVQPALNELREDLASVLAETDPQYEILVDHSSEDRKYWFRNQLIEIAHRYNYFCDTSTHHQWSRLKIRHRGSDEQGVEIVISIHALGRIFSGVLVVSGYVADRDRDDDGRTVAEAPRLIADRPLSFTYAEPLGEVKARCEEWLAMALNVALESFRRSL